MTEPSSVPRSVFRAAFGGTPRVSPPSASASSVDLASLGQQRILFFLRSGKYYDLATKNQSQIRSRKDYEACVSLKTHQAFTRYEDNHVGAFNAAALFSLRDEILQISHTAL